MRSPRGPARLLVASVVAAGAGCAGSGAPTSWNQEPDTARVALSDLGNGNYLGFRGGLYPDGSDDPPAAHAAAGVAAAQRIQPLAADGTPSPDGKIVLISIGMSNTTMEFCSGAFPQCGSVSFVAQARADPRVNHSTLVLVEGARGGQTPPSWQSSTLPQFDSARARLRAAGVTEAQVQVAWLKQADAQPTKSLPAPDADAYALERGLGDVVRALHVRYPNLRQVFLSSRIYGGYATTTLNPEPYAYEGGFAVKWLIESQITQAGPTAHGDARAGDLAYGTTPWLAWGPYLWANGTHARADGLTYVAQDFGTDGTHPNESARQKVGKLLSDFFATSPSTRCWFLAVQSCK